MTTRSEMLARVASAHKAWSLAHGDTVPYVAADANPHDGQATDLPIWQADRSATPETDAELTAELERILAEGYDEEEAPPEIPDDDDLPEDGGL